ncbi:S-methyl-5-thioribose-1-phosphate isomerase [Bacteriovoracaceae bacterium]|nr:S-methyl-5-thioribose-1-phosphate isomerase [Bacteriovoracaceae bacterium]
MRNVKEPLIWENNKLKLIDQRKLPHEEVYIEYSTHEGAFDGIRLMVVRGAPLIGFAGLYGMVLYSINHPKSTVEDFNKAADYLNEARPTAVNLSFELERTKTLAASYFEKNNSLEGLTAELLKMATESFQELADNNLKMAKSAMKELEGLYGTRKLNVVTLCNTGYLACGPMGTALGVIAHLHENERIEHVYASETRPYLQGGRLTAYELCQLNVPHSLIVEGAFSYLMKNKKIDAIFIGADRIVLNGDTANKVGSSTLSIVAKNYGVPFYVVAPTSSFDFAAKTGEEIEIEMRPEEEILSCQGVRIAPKDSRALNPSFDVTDHENISGIFCEKGIIKPVDSENVSKVCL